MATIGRTSGASFLNTPRLSYIATAAFNTYFYSYTTSINMSLETIGTLAAVTGANAGNCPMGRVLRENGRKLYPGANPGITTYLVGVYDAQTLLTGFIDPNAGVFQIYNTDKPTYLLDGVEPTVASTDRGPSIYTRGNVLGGGDLDISGNAHIYGSEIIDQGLTVHLGAIIDNTAGTGLTVYNGETVATGNLGVTLGNITAAAGNIAATLGDITAAAGNIAATVGTITAGKQIRSTTLTNLGSVNTSQVINCTLGQVFKMTITGGISITATAGSYPVGTVVYIIITSTGNYNVDFDTDFRTLNAGVRNINTTTATFSFVSDGTALWQIGEANGLTA